MKVLRHDSSVAAGPARSLVGAGVRGRAATARRGLISASDADDLAACFRLLGDPKRVRILYALLGAGELCVCDIAATAEVSETTVSHAMRLLRTAGIVRNRRDGRTVYYRLDDAHVRLLLDVSKEHVVHEGHEGAVER
jgi:DNA-binding transcriptional ArsR family regulator